MLTPSSYSRPGLVQTSSAPSIDATPPPSNKCVLDGFDKNHVFEYVALCGVELTTPSTRRRRRGLTGEDDGDENRHGDDDHLSRTGHPLRNFVCVYLL